MFGYARTSFVTWRRETTGTMSFLAGVTLCGLLFGGVVAGQLNASTAAVLNQAMQHFIAAVQHHDLQSAPTIWWSRAFAEAGLFGVVWLSGLSLLGLPVVVVTLFLRAFCVGFSVAYSVLTFGWHGFLIASLVIFAHQVLALAGLLGAGTLAVRLSGSIFRRSLDMSAMPRVLVRYTACVCLCLCLASLGAALQVFAAPPVLGALLPPS